MTQARFPLGRLVATPGALERIRHDAMLLALARHAQGDWGDVDQEDHDTNERALKIGARLMSVYKCDEEVFWIITEADRSATTVLLPEDY